MLLMEKFYKGLMEDFSRNQVINPGGVLRRAQNWMRTLDRGGQTFFRT